MKQYHVLVAGFELHKSNRGDITTLRHYRFDLDTHSITPENGSWVVKQGKEFKAAFPINRTMIVVEEVDEQK